MQKPCIFRVWVTVICAATVTFLFMLVLWLSLLSSCQPSNPIRVAQAEAFPLSSLTAIKSRRADRYCNISANDQRSAHQLTGATDMRVLALAGELEPEVIVGLVSPACCPGGSGWDRHLVYAP